MNAACAVVEEPNTQDCGVCEPSLAPILPLKVATQTREHWDGTRMINVSKERAEALVFAERELLHYAEWNKKHRGQLGYPTVTAFYKAMKRRAVHGERGQVARNPMLPNVDHTKLGGPEHTAMGKETRSFRPVTVDDPDDRVLRSEKIVNAMPPELYDVIQSWLFVYGPIEARARASGLKLKKFCELLRAGKYAFAVAWKATA